MTRLFSRYAAGFLIAVSCAKAQPADLKVLLEHAILEAGQPLKEVEDYTEAKVPLMPKVRSLEEWERYAQRTRQEVLDKVVFRGEAARQWRDAKCQVEWLGTMAGGPEYQIKKLRYEVLPGSWIPALLYEPLKITGKIPLHLAVNGHDPVGKAAPYKQIRCINLAKRGIASLNVEWFNMGQLRGDGFKHSQINQLDLCGASGLAPFYLAMSRGLDILLGLPYADAKRVAVSGLSGGGWQTIFISSLDTRVTLSNPVAGYSSFRTRARFATDLGDSEQTPNDLATITDYAPLTAMLAGRAALLTFNKKDNCCFGSDHALEPLLEAAQPIFALYGQKDRLRSHINYEPGTHNFEVDNRQALYAIVGAEFFAGDASYSATEIPAEAEVKTAAELDVPLPNNNLDFHQLALSLSKGLPHVIESADAARKKLAEVVNYTDYQVTAKPSGDQASGGLRTTYWKLHMGGHWTVPVVELSPEKPRDIVILVADGGRKSAVKELEAALAAGHRVLALDPFYLGESRIQQRDYLYALLVAAVGGRATGLQASQIAAAARWAAETFKGEKVIVQAIGQRISLAALTAAALERKAISRVEVSQALDSLHAAVEGSWDVAEKTELFCFGLLESFDMPQLRQLAGADPAR